MADTGPPWNLRFPGPQDFVRETNFYIEDLAEDTAAALSAAGGLVAVKHVLKTDTFTASSVAAGGNEPVTGLSITHALADEDNRLIITAFFGSSGSEQQFGMVGIAVSDGTSLLAIADADGSKVRTTAGGSNAGTGTDRPVTMPSVTFVHSPNTTDPVTYQVVVINIRNGVSTLFVNRTQDTQNNATNAHAASALTIQEVKV